MSEVLEVTTEQRAALRAGLARHLSTEIPPAASTGGPMTGIDGLLVCKGCPEAAAVAAEQWEQWLFLSRDAAGKRELIAGLYADPEFPDHRRVMGLFRSLPGKEWAAILFVWDPALKIPYDQSNEQLGFIGHMPGVSGSFFVAGKVDGDPRTGPVTWKWSEELTGESRNATGSAEHR